MLNNPKKSLQEEMAFNIQYNCHGKILETPLYGPHIYMFTQYLCCLCYSQFLRIVHGLKWCFDDVFLIERLSCDLLVEGSLPTTCLLGSWNLQLVPFSQIEPNFDYRDSQDQHNHLRVSIHSRHFGIDKKLWSVFFFHVAIFPDYFDMKNDLSPSNKGL